MSIKIRAKSTCISVTYYDETAEVKLEPVIDGSEENEMFYTYTPGGEIELSLVEITTANRFKLGKEYYVDFTEAVKNDSQSD